MAGEADQPPKLIEFHCWPVGYVISHWINANKDRIAIEWKWHAGHPELVVWRTIQFVTVDNKLVFACEGRAMLDSPAPDGVPDRIGVIVQHSVKHASLGHEDKLAIFHRRTA
jgi:hypothetical protein